MKILICKLGIERRCVRFGFSQFYTVYSPTLDEPADIVFLDVDNVDISSAFIFGDGRSFDELLADYKEKYSPTAIFLFSVKKRRSWQTIDFSRHGFK